MSEALKQEVLNNLLALNNVSGYECEFNHISEASAIESNPDESLSSVDYSSILEAYQF